MGKLGKVLAVVAILVTGLTIQTEPAHAGYKTVCTWEIVNTWGDYGWVCRTVYVYDPDDP